MKTIFIFLSLCSFSFSQDSGFSDLNFRFVDVNHGLKMGRVSNIGGVVCYSASLKSESSKGINHFLDRLYVDGSIGAVFVEETLNEEGAPLYFRGVGGYDVKKQPTDVHVYVGAGFQNDFKAGNGESPFLFNFQICTDYELKFPIDFTIDLDIIPGGGINAFVGFKLDLNKNDERD